MAHDVSAYSLVALARAAAPLMTDGGSIVAMSYYGAEKVVPHYNVMGVAKAALEASTRYLAYDLGPKKIRVNCISAGPVNTLAARGIGGFTEMLKQYEAQVAAQTKCLAGRTRRDGDVSGQRRRGGHHRAGDLRGFRLSNHGDVGRASRLSYDATYFIFATYAPSTLSANGSNSRSLSNLKWACCAKIPSPLRHFPPAPGCKCCKPKRRRVSILSRRAGANPVASVAAAIFPPAKSASANPRVGASRRCWSRERPPKPGQTADRIYDLRYSIYARFLASDSSIANRKS